MSHATVNVSGKYDIQIGHGLLSEIGDALFALNQKTCRVCILSDDNVFPLYGDIVIHSLQSSGFSVSHFVIPPGEASKCMETYSAFLNYIATEHLTRSDWIIALGGGVVGDLCGFSAATYLRGVRYIQVPTTLLAMVDSSVGGKTAIDLPAGKNLCGAFYPPVAVICDIDTLSTLPDNFFADGMAEVIKYGMIFDRPMLETLLRDGIHFNRPEIIQRCVCHKRDVVEEDEFDHGIRMLLNFGHTVAHGIEQYSGYTVSHGHAVAAGMAVVTRAAQKAGLFTPADTDLLTRLLQIFGLPIDSPYPAKQLTDAILSDKKRDGDVLRIVIADSPGHAVLHPIPIDLCEEFFASGILSATDG